MLKKQRSQICFGLNRALMACLTRYEHPFLKQFHALPQPQSTAACHPRSQFVGGINCADNCNSGFKGNRVSGLTLTLKGCFDDSRSSCERRPRAFVPQSARNLEVISLGEATKDAKLEKDPKLSANGRGRGSPLGFLDRSDKIAVAVDVDEVLGNFLSALNRFISDRYSLNHSVSEYYVYEFFKLISVSMSSLRHHISRKESNLSQVLERHFIIYPDFVTCQL